MKKLITLILTLVLTSTIFAGCSSGGSSNPGGTGATSQGTDDKVYKVGIVQMAENDAFADMREGFIARMRELGYDEARMQIEYKNAQGDASNLNTICQDMISAKMDVIVPIATPSTQAIVNQDSGIPVFFISVADPVSAGVMSDLSTPDKNATGASNAVPVDKIFGLGDALTPGIETYGLLYSSGEANAVKTIADAKAYLDSIGVGYVEQVVTNSSEVQQAAQALVGKADAIFVPIDSMVQSAMPQVAEVAKEAKAPVYGSSAVMVASGALGTVSMDDTEIGRMAADLLHEHLTGTPIEKIPAARLETVFPVINRTTAEALGIEIPDTLSDAVLIG